MIRTEHAKKTLAKCAELFVRAITCKTCKNSFTETFEFSIYDQHTKLVLYVDAAVLSIW
jgi:hypothetical protein